MSGKSKVEEEIGDFHIVDRDRFNLNLLLLRRLQCDTSVSDIVQLPRLTHDRRRRFDRNLGLDVILQMRERSTEFFVDSLWARCQHKKRAR